MSDLTEEQRLLRNEKARLYYEKHKDQHKQRVKNWTKENYEQFRLYQDQYYADKQGLTLEQYHQKKRRPKLTLREKIAICEAYTGEHGCMKQIAKQFGVNPSTVTRIIKDNRIWKLLKKQS